MSSEVEAESEPWVGRGGASYGARGGWERRSFLWRLRLDLAAVSLTLSSGTAVGAGQAALFSCQVGQWSGEVTAVTSALPTEERAQDKVSDDPCIECSCDTVGWRGDLAKVASLRRLGLERAEGVSVA